MPPRRPEEEKVCLYNTYRKIIWMLFTAIIWTTFACTTSLMAASIFGDMNNGRFKHKVIKLFGIEVTQYQAAIYCTGFLFEIAALFNSMDTAALKLEEEKKKQANCHCP